MKRFKIFKIVYYGFMTVIGIVMCFILPSYNQYNYLSKDLNSSIKNEEYTKLASYFGAIYNEEPILNKKNDNGSTVLLYETICYDYIDSEDSYFYADLVYMGFVLNPDGYNYDDTTDSSGNIYNGRKIQVNGNVDIEIDDTYFYYVDESNFFYFEISGFELEKNNVEKINKIDIIANDGSSYVSYDNLNFSFENSDFYSVATEYRDLVNLSIYHNVLEITGNIIYNAEGSQVKSGTSLKYIPYGSPSLKIECDNLDNLTITNAEKQEDGTYALSSNNELEIYVKADTRINSLTFIYGNIEVRYGFDSVESIYSLKSDVNSSDTLGQEYDYDDVNGKYNTWKENYDKYSDTGYKIADFSSIITKAKVMAVVQVVIYFLIIFIIGDFIVGKRHILNLYYKLFGKNKKGKTEEDEIVINNEYEVNVVCEARVPVGYKDKISVVYGKATGEKMLFELDSLHNYKMAKRYINGEYEFLGLEAQGLHLIKTNKKINVRGYRFELILSFAYDEVKPEGNSIVSQLEENLNNETLDVKNSSEEVLEEEFLQNEIIEENNSDNE